MGRRGTVSFIGGDVKVLRMARTYSGSGIA